MNLVFRLFLFLLLEMPSILWGLTLQPIGLETLKESLLPTHSTQLNFFTGDDFSQKHKMFEALKIEYKAYSDKEKQFSDALDKQMNVIKTEIDYVKSMLNHYGNNNGSAISDYLSKKLTILNKKYQTIPDIRETRQQIIENMKLHVEYLDKYFQSSDSSEHIAEKTLYTFSDLQKLTRQISLEKDAVSRLQNKKENEDAIVLRTESYIVSKDKELKFINESLEILKKSTGDVKNQLMLQDLEKELFILERELAMLRVDEHLQVIEFTQSQMFVMNHKLDRLYKDLTMVRSRMKVDKQDLHHYQHIHNDVKKEVQAKTADLMKKRTELAAQKIILQDELEKLSERYKISLSNISKIEDWDILIESINEGFSTFSVAFTQAQLNFLERKIDAVRVSLLLEDAKLAHAQSLENSVESLYSMTQVKYNDIDQLEKERIHYKDLKNTVQNMIKMYQDRTQELNLFMQSQYKKIANIKKTQDLFKSFPADHIATNQKKYNEGLAILTKALKLIEEQGSASLKLSEQYTTLIEQKEETLVLASFMLQELDLIGVWHRSNRAVTFEGIKQIIPNLVTFAQNVYGVIVDYFLHVHIMKDIYEFVTTSTAQLFSYILFFIFLYIVFLCMQAILPALFNGLMLITSDIQGLFLLIRILAVICGFLQQNLGAIFIWFFFFLCLHIYQISIAFTLVFYMYSILFLLYIARSFLQYLLEFNQSIQFALLGKSFEDRFSWIFSFFSASTIFILFFRKMFMLVMMYQQSEFPIILLRLYHIVIFISVVFSIEKEELLHLIPKSNIYFQSLSQLIDNYYYLLALFCILVLILSDPYLGGYGYLMWYMILNFTMSLILCATIYLVYNAIKVISSWMFFREYGEFGLKERFEYAKTWYAIFLVLLFFVAMVSAVLFLAQIWGYPLAFGQLERILNHTLTSWQSGTGGRMEHLKVIGIIRLIASVFLGFIFAFLFRRYVLQRVFDIQYVDPGVQDTIMTITRYLIIVGTIFIGFAREGLGTYVLYVLAVGLFGFGWTFKDLFADVVAYFFILVQRPIKVGDYIKIDHEIMGVVKKISTRAVVLRKKNSVTIMIPNSIILKSILLNWNSTRGYIAFDDIILSVPFSVDPLEVKKILFQVILKHQDVLKVPEPVIRLDDFNDKGYTFMVRGFISSANTLHQWDIASDVRFLIVAALRAQGIEVAQPIIHVKMP